MHIFRCKHTKLWFCCWKVTRSKDLSQNQIFPLTIVSQERYICDLFHSPLPYQTPCPATVFNFTAWMLKAPGSSFALESIDLAASPVSVPQVGTVNHEGSSIDLPSSVFFSTLGLMAFPDPSVCTSSGLGGGPNHLIEFVLLGHQDRWVSGSSSEHEVLQTETKDISNSTSPAFSHPHKACFGDCWKPHSSGKEHFVTFF